jgi:hypothetical protein
MQPLIVAAAKDMGKTVEALIAHGVDPNTLEKTAWGIFASNASWQVGESLLDIIQKKLKILRDYKASLTITVHDAVIANSEP